MVILDSHWSACRALLLPHAAASTNRGPRSSPVPSYHSLRCQDAAKTPLRQVRSHSNKVETVPPGVNASCTLSFVKPSTKRWASGDVNHRGPGQARAGPGPNKKKQIKDHSLKNKKIFLYYIHTRAGRLEKAKNQRKNRLSLKMSLLENLKSLIQNGFLMVLFMKS